MEDKNYILKFSSIVAVIYAAGILLVDYILFNFINTSFNNYTYVGYVTSLIGLGIEIYVGYKIGSMYKNSKKAFKAGLILGAITSLISGAVTPIIIANSKYYLPELIKGVSQYPGAADSVRESVTTFSPLFTLIGVGFGALITGLIAWAAGAVGSSRARKEEQI